MQINTDFNIGDMVHTIDPKTMKAKIFKLDSYSVIVNGNGTFAYLYAKGETSGYAENRCFHTDVELKNFLFN